jgi:hypothetical protein
MARENQTIEREVNVTAAKAAGVELYIISIEREMF